MSSLSAPDAWWERGASVSLRAVTWGDSQPVRYAVTVNVLSHSYTIMRRYRAFDALNRSLRELAQQHAVAWDPVARLPPKAVLRSRSSAFLESRRAALENYLNDVLAAVSPCVQHAELRRELAAFLELRLLPSGERVMGEAPALDSAALVREKRVAWRGGATVVDSGRVYFAHLDAARRVVRRTLLSTDATFFERAQWMHIPYTPPQRDIEAARSCVSRSPPLVADVPLTSGPALLSLADVTAHIHKLKQLFPEGYDGMWRLNGRTANDIPALNTLIRAVMQELPDRQVLLDIPSNRIAALASLENSILLAPWIVPSVRIYVSCGEELEALKELREAVAAVSGFTDISLSITLVVHRPLPNLYDLLTEVRKREHLVSAVVVEVERSVKKMLQVTQETESSLTEDDTSLDPMDIIDQVCDVVGFDAGREEFVPLSAAAIAEPLLRVIGYGRYLVRPSPFCAFGAALIRGKPLSHSVDIHRLFHTISPLVQHGSRSGLRALLTAKKMQSALAKCMKVPVDIAKYLTSTKDEDTKLVESTLKTLQFFVVHAKMDIFDLDGNRRLGCAAVTVGKLGEDGFAASCTGCM